MAESSYVKVYSLLSKTDECRSWLEDLFREKLTASCFRTKFSVAVENIWTDHPSVSIIWSTGIDTRHHDVISDYSMRVARSVPGPMLSNDYVYMNMRDGVTKVANRVVEACFGKSVPTYFLNRRVILGQVELPDKDKLPRRLKKQMENHGTFPDYLISTEDSRIAEVSAEANLRVISLVNDHMASEDFIHQRSMAIKLFISKNIEKALLPFKKFPEEIGNAFREYQVADMLDL